MLASVYTIIQHKDFFTNLLNKVGETISLDELVRNVATLKELGSDIVIIALSYVIGRPIHLINTELTNIYKYSNNEDISIATNKLYQHEPITLVLHYKHFTSLLKHSREQTLHSLPINRIFN